MPSRQRRLLAVIAAGALLVGCAKNPVTVNSVGTVSHALIPDNSLKLGPSVFQPLEKLVYWGVWVGAAWLILDPLAPNWEIEEASLPEGYMHFKLSMKRYYAGGAGEARQVLNRRAKELMRTGGYGNFEIVEYAEGLESSVLGSKRTAESVIRLTGKAG